MEELRKNFEKFYESLKTSPDPETLKEAFWVTYLQGHNDRTPQKEVPIEQVAKDIDDECFFDFVKSCLKPEGLVIGPDHVMASDYVEVEYPCSAKEKSKCVSFPDRCEGTCKRLINISKLCGVEVAHTIFVKNKDLLTHEEAALLSRTLADYVNKGGN
jgi:hypothetical protein